MARSIYDTVQTYVLRNKDRSLTAAEWAEAMQNETDWMYQASYTPAQVQTALTQLAKHEDNLIKAVGTGRSRRFHSAKYQGAIAPVP